MQWRRVARYAVPGVVYLVVLLAVFWRLWTPIDDARRAFGWDAIWEYWGDLQYLADSFGDFEMPLWNWHDRGGYPFHADPQVGILYPPSWVLVGFAWLLGSTPWWLIAVKIILHFWIICTGFHALLRRNGAPEPACYAAGLIFLLSYAVTQNLFSALNWNLAWAPWCMLAVQVWAERPSYGRGALVALAFGMCALAGAPGAFWYALLVIVPYGAWAVVRASREAGDRGAYVRRAALTTGAAGGLVLAMVLAQFSGTATLVGESVRATRDLDFIAFSTFGADDIAGFVIPRNVGGNTYLGFATVLWAGVLLTAGWTPRRLVLGGVAVFGVLMALGSQGDFLPFASSAFPPFGFFRRAHRYLYVTQIAVALLAAEGLGELIRMESGELRKRVRGAVVVVGLLGLGVFATGYVVKASAHAKEQPLRDAFALAAVAVVVTTWVTYMILRVDGRWRQAFGIIAVVALGCDLWYAQARRIDQMMHAVPRTPHDAFALGLDGVASGDVRIYDREHVKFRPGIRLGLRDYGGYEGDPLALGRYSELRDRLVAAPRALGHANVRYLFEAGKGKTRKSPADTAAMTMLRNGVYELKQVAPAAFWVPGAVLVDGRDAAWSELSRAEPGRIAVMERATAPDGVPVASAPATETVAATVVGRSRDSLTLELDAPAAGVVVVNESYYPHWTARVDGAVTPIAPTNLQFRGIVVGPGPHRIEMRYQPPAYRPLAALSVLAMLAALSLVIVERRRHA